MQIPSVAGLPDDQLARTLASLAARDRENTVAMLVCLEEAERRQIYAPAGYDKMHRYCVHVLRMSEDMAWRRLATARAACRWPQIYSAIAGGLLTISSVAMLSRYLTDENVNDLLKDAVGLSYRHLDRMLARRFPRPDLPTRWHRRAANVVAALDATVREDTADVAEEPRTDTPELQRPDPGQLMLDMTESPATSRLSDPEHSASEDTPVSAASSSRAPAPDGTPAHTPAAERTRVMYVAPARVALQVTLSEQALALLEEAQALLTHSGSHRPDLAEVIENAAELLVAKLRKQRFGEGVESRGRSGSQDPRYIPSSIRQTVIERDGEGCGYVAPDGTRCGTLENLEFDHITPVARGGTATAENLRLRCRRHNQLEAENLYGEAFMQAKRENKEPALPKLQERGPDCRRVLEPS